jgi:glycine dehydrogenase subunit 1
VKFTQLTEADVRHMLGAIGAGSVDDLLKPVPQELRLKEPLKIPGPLSELELVRQVKALAARNVSTEQQACFAGGGAYDHFIPAVVDALASQPAFVTAYTPYQAEASQGALQALYEYQTLMCELLGMDVSNASTYELASTVAEAALMARSITGKGRIVVSRLINPDCMAVLKTYLKSQPIEIAVAGMSNGQTDLDDLRRLITGDTAAVIVQSPNYLGGVERLDKIGEIARGNEALFVVAADPISCGLLKKPGDFGADIVVAEGQPLGIPLGLGGPYLGILTCKQELLRKIPGRLVGMTTDRLGRRGFCLTLQTREQHIRRERATSNICTNQGVVAIRAAIYLAAVGRQGIRKVASLCLDKAHYAANRIASVSGFDLRFDAPFFKEFVVRSSKPLDRVFAACREKGILIGPGLGKDLPELADCFLVAVTEKRSKEEIDRLVDALEGA